jgi:repressor of nif and glnA expression
MIYNGFSSSTHPVNYFYNTQVEESKKIIQNGTNNLIGSNNNNINSNAIDRLAEIEKELERLRRVLEEGEE